MLNSHVHGMHLDVVGTTFFGAPYGFATPVRADAGHVLFGHNGSTVIDIDMQPYTFKSEADVDASLAPKYAAGYFALPNSVTRGPQEGPSAWTNTDAYRNLAGAKVRVNFAVTNAVNSFYLQTSDSLITVMSNITALGVALVLYFTRGGMRLIEAFPGFVAATKAYVERMQDPDADMKEQAEAEARARVRAANAPVEKELVLTSDEVALSTMVQNVVSQQTLTEAARKAAVRNMDAGALCVRDVGVELGGQIMSHHLQRNVLQSTVSFIANTRSHSGRLLRGGSPYCQHCVLNPLFVRLFALSDLCPSWPPSFRRVPAPPVAAHVAELKREEAAKANAQAEEAARAAAEAELDGAAPAGGGKRGGSGGGGGNGSAASGELATAHLYPWKSVVNDLITHCEPKDLVSVCDTVTILFVVGRFELSHSHSCVPLLIPFSSFLPLVISPKCIRIRQALAYAAERDQSSMKMLAEVFAPYLHLRAMELRPVGGVGGIGGGGGGGGRAASNRPKLL